MKTTKSSPPNRQATHGPFCEFAATAQHLKEEMRCAPGWAKLPAEMKEALDMIQHKAARILTGDPRHLDHWVDIGGYAARVAEALDVKTKS